MASEQIWDVIGGAEKGGIVVRRECDLNSEALDNRLSTGAKIKQLELRGQRLHYKLLTGSGPAEGWVSLALKGQALVCKQNPLDAKRSLLTLDKLLLRHESDGTFAENYETKDIQLGEGGFASVFVAKNVSTGQERAVKRLPYRRQEELIQIDAECRILVRLGHPHIMKFYEFFREPNMIYLVTELCTGGTFNEFFRDGLYDTEDARILFQQVLSAVQHCHKLRVLHHDLKPENCLILKASGRPFAKVIDFGISTIMQKSNRQPAVQELKDSSEEEEEQDTITKLTGSPWWRAPEVFDENSCSGPKADLYSIGLIMFLCITGVHPLHHGSWCEPMGAHESPDMYDKMLLEDLEDSNLPDEAQELILALLENDKEKRLSAKQALESPWFEASWQMSKEYPASPRKMVENRISYSGLSEAWPSPNCSPKSSRPGSPKFPSIAENLDAFDTFGDGEPSENAASQPLHMCPADHVVKHFLTEEDGYSCSICNLDFPEATDLYGCRICDFDACETCVKSLKVKKQVRTRSMSPNASNLSAPRRKRLGSVRLLLTKDNKFKALQQGSGRPGSPKDTRFRHTRHRRGSKRSALLLDRVLRYKDLEPWHCAVLRLIAHNSHESDVAKQRERYFKMDTTKSGALSRNELVEAMIAHGNLVEEDQIEGIFLNLDSQGTGEIEYNEWIASTMKPSIICQEEVMQMVFAFFDTHHRGCFGHEELKAVLGVSAANAMLRRAGVKEFTWESFMELMKAAATD